jgi:hypothetical protein
MFGWRGKDFWDWLLILTQSLSGFLNDIMYSSTTIIYVRAGSPQYKLFEKDFGKPAPTLISRLINQT